ncbi:MAG: carboxymuconolactone decarboxylase family protein [Filomicrobium sp.]
MKIELHDHETAPDGSKATLAAVNEANGFIPNLFRALGNSPSTLNGFVALVQANDGGTLSPAERQIVQLTASMENRAGYCIAGHSAFATRIGMPIEMITAIRESRPLPDRRHQALVDFTRALVRSRGHVTDDEKEAFEAAGFGTDQVLEIIAGIALKTVTNFVSSSLDLPLDPQFQPYARTTDSDQVVAPEYDAMAS